MGLWKQWFCIYFLVVNLDTILLTFTYIYIVDDFHVSVTFYPIKAFLFFTLASPHIFFLCANYFVVWTSVFCCCCCLLNVSYNDVYRISLKKKPKEPMKTNLFSNFLESLGIIRFHLVLLPECKVIMIY